MQKSNEIKEFSTHESFFKEQTGNDFSFFYKKYHPKLVYFTSRMCNDQQRAEDVTAESFITAFEKIDKYDREKSQFSTWLFTIARNKMLQDIKDEKKKVSIDTEFDDEGTTLKDFIHEEESFEHIHDLTSKKSEIMLKHIQELKQPYKMVMEMREINKMSYKDIAFELNICESTLKSRIRNGRIILKKSTKNEFDNIDKIYS